jgi:WD40-like Beta Propeller Repeat
MEKKAWSTVAIVTLSVCVISCGNTEIVEEATQGFEALSGPYFGQASPGDEPQLFLPGLVTTCGLDIDIAFLDEGRACVFSNSTDRIFYTYEKDGRWTTPVEAPFPDDSGKTQYSAEPGGVSLFFQSDRKTSATDDREDLNTWSVDWTGEGWTEPRCLPPPANTPEHHEICPAVASNGDLFFFSGWRKDDPLGDLYRVPANAGPDERAEKLPFPINTAFHELDPVVSPDGRFLIFYSNRPGGYGFGDLYVTFAREDGTWTNPRNLGERINSFGPNAACITPGGKYFFFASSQSTSVPKGDPVHSALIDRVGDIDLYWVETGFIRNIEMSLGTMENGAELIDREYQTIGIQPAVATLERLWSEHPDEFEFPLSELLMSCANMINNGRGNDAEVFYQALLETLPDSRRVRQGFAATCILNERAERGLELLGSLWHDYPDAKSEGDLEPVVSTLGFLGRTGDERLLLEFVVREFPSSHQAQYNLAEALHRDNDTEGAIEHCRKAVALNSDFTEALRLLEELEAEQVARG